MTDTGWTKTLALDDLRRRGRAVVRVGKKQIALFADGARVLACNNRCPHEGYPLAEGTLGEGCVLTCNWHNWKFDLKSGRNLMGFDELPIYPTRVDDGVVWVQIVDRPQGERETLAWRRLREAFDDHDYERIARELARLKAAGVDPLDAVAEAIAWSHDRLEFGMTHAYAATADWLALYADRATPADLKVAALVEAIGHMAWDSLRFPVFPYPKRKRRFSEGALEDAIEAEDMAAAVGLVRGALAAGLGFSAMERALSRAALRHYADFGHALIYVTKVGDLIGRLGPRVEEPLLLALVRALIFAFREDKIPEFRNYAKERSRWGQGKGNGAALDPRDLYRASINQSLAWTVDHAASPPLALHRALLEANARNLLTFDTRVQDRHDNNVGDNVGWLDFTHALTFGSALRAQAAKFPELWPDGLLQLACFNGRNAGFVDPDLDVLGWRPGDRAAFWSTARDGIFDHGRRDYIFSAHLLKTFCAVWAETGSGDNDDVLLAALNRFLNGRIKEKHVRRTARQAVAFVAREG